MNEVVILLVSLLVILAGAELFTNGIEWLGHKLGLAEGAVGSVLAAVGTALPETLIPIIAIAFTAGDASDEIGVGAILGAPFMLSTLAMFVTGIGIIAFRSRRASGTTAVVDTRVLAHDLRYFFVGYGLAIGAAFLPTDLAPARWLVAVVLVGMYAWYVKGHLDAESQSEAGDLEPLRLHRLDGAAHRDDPTVPRLRIVYVQVLAAVALIIIGAVFFIDAVEHVADALGVSEVLLSLVIAPIATELPEKFNSIIWVRQNKDTLALGNITGAMVFQSTIPTVVGLVLAAETWTIAQGNYTAFASAAIALVATAVIFIPARRRGRLDARHLLVGGLFYLGYLAFVILLVSGAIGS
jgi:cation:H+ antiporter